MNNSSITYEQNSCKPTLKMNSTFSCPEINNLPYSTTTTTLNQGKLVNRPDFRNSLIIPSQHQTNYNNNDRINNISNSHKSYLSYSQVDTLGSPLPFINSNLPNRSSSSPQSSIYSPTFTRQSSYPYLLSMNKPLLNQNLVSEPSSNFNTSLNNNISSPHIQNENYNYQKAPSFEVSTSNTLIQPICTPTSTTTSIQNNNLNSNKSNQKRHTPKFTIGYRSDCKKCRDHVPNHYGHII